MQSVRHRKPELKSHQLKIYNYVTYHPPLKAQLPVFRETVHIAEYERY